jgi:hypothetical protein
VKRRAAWIIFFASATAGATPSAHDSDAIDRTAKAAYDEGKYAFCTSPSRPLGPRQQQLCALAAEVPECKGLLEACHMAERPKDLGWLERLAQMLGPIAKVLLYVLVAGIILIVAIPVVRALAKARRDRRLAEATREPNRAVIENEEPETPRELLEDEEAALRLADEHHRRGELGTALGLYLSAALAALDRRGAIRIGRHRTNGEYVRTCSEEASRAPLRAIVREVDKADFGDAPPTSDDVSQAASRARSIVRAAVTIAALSLLFGCSSLVNRSGDPAADDLPLKVLEKNGFTVSPLASSLATLPIPEGDRGAPVVVVDVEKVPLEDESKAHMMRWVEAGGVLVLLGGPSDWPEELHATFVGAETRDLVVRTRDPNGGLADTDAEDEDPRSIGQSIEISGARTARRDAFAFGDKYGQETIGFLGTAPYAAKVHVGKGIVLGVANDDLLTNIGMMPPRNAAALVTLIRSASHDPERRFPEGALSTLQVARRGDGIPPPDNPFAALIAAGLGKGAWHLLAGAIILFLAYGIRHARPRTPERTARRAFAEHVEATGAFYHRAGAKTHALGAYGRFMELRLREHVPRGGDPAAFLAARTGVETAHIAKLYERALKTKAEDEPQGDELEVIEELRGLMEKALLRNESASRA